MENSKDTTVTVRLGEADKAALKALCEQEDITPSQVVRRLIRQHLKQHGHKSAAVAPSLS